VTGTLRPGRKARNLLPPCETSFLVYGSPGAVTSSESLMAGCDNIAKQKPTVRPPSGR